jgi:hypothetical protein
MPTSCGMIACDFRVCNIFFMDTLLFIYRLFRQKQVF